MKRTMTCAGLAFALAFASLADAAAKDKRKANPASHDPAFFEELLTGRAFVYAKPHNKGQTWDESDQVAGGFFGADGRAFLCTRRKGSTKAHTLNWQIMSSDKHRTVIALHKDKDDPRKSRYQQVPFYDGETGRFRLHGWSSNWRKWVVWTEGWVQESWPRALADMCKKLKLPEGVAINEAQTEMRLSRLKKQDPDTALVRFKAK